MCVCVRERERENVTVRVRERERETDGVDDEGCLAWLPHCPTCSVISSRGILPTKGQTRRTKAKGGKEAGKGETARGDGGQRLARCAFSGG